MLAFLRKSTQAVGQPSSTKGTKGRWSLKESFTRKRPALGILSMEDERCNKKVSSDRILVENVFGKLSSLWSVLSYKYRWKEDTYDTILRFCLGMTNFHIRAHSLREGEREIYNRVKNRQYTIGNNTAEKRRRSQETYRQKRRERMRIQFHCNAMPERQPDDDEN